MIWFAAGVMLLTTLPYWLGYAAQGETMRFTGFVFGVEDGNSYIAKMLSGSVGAWTFRTPYTTLPQRGAPIFLPYLSLGKLAASPGLHEQLVALYHGFRIIAGILAILASYDFLAIFIRDVRLRRGGVALVALGGGLGWIPALSGQPQWFGSLPLEFSSPESFGFLAIYGLPHLALARALLLWGFVAYLGATASPGTSHKMRSGTKAGILWLLASLAQPLAGLIAGLVCSAHLIALAARLVWLRDQQTETNWQSWLRPVRLALWAGLFPALLAIANFWIAQNDLFLQAWMEQNRILSPHPFHYLLAYGLFIPFVISGSMRLLRWEPLKGWFLVAWILALPALAYTPVNLQRRLVEGVWVAIAALSLAAIDRKSEETGEGESGLKSSLKWKFFALAGILALPSAAILLAGGFQIAGQPIQPAFRPADEVAVFEEVARRGPLESAVLASYETGNALPAWAPARVVLGHGPESAGLDDLLPRVKSFFDPRTPASDRLDLLAETGARYVVWGPAERDLGSWDPSSASFLKEVERQGEYQLFEVIEQ